MLFFPLAWTDVCSLQINYKIWREEFCLVLFPCKISPSCWFFTVYTFTAQELEGKKTEQLGFAEDSSFSISTFAFLSPLRPPVDYQVCFPSCCFFPFRQQEKKCSFSYECLHFPALHIFHLRGQVRPQLTETLADRLNFMQQPWSMFSLGNL